MHKSSAMIETPGNRSFAFRDKKKGKQDNYRPELLLSK